jgi:hypothetical protein
VIEQEPQTLTGTFRHPSTGAVRRVEFVTMYEPFGHDGIGPQGFLVEMLPEHVGPAHFHDINQFQVFFPARGARYQRTAIDAVLLHYADAYATYGPFESGAEPLQFFTLRATHTRFIGYMPTDRDKIVRRGGRNVHVEVPPRRLDTSQGTVDALIGPHPDGLAAHRLTAGAGGSLPIPASGGIGKYVLVLDGEVLHDGERHGAQSLAWLDPEGPEVLSAPKSSGFDALVMEFPVPIAD